MRPPFLALTALVVLVDMYLTSAQSSTTTPFSSSFHQPDPPTLQSEFKANWNQHKWDENVSHIASGYIYNSPSNAKVRADLAATAELGSSLFDYTNVTDAGVANTLWTLGPAVTSRPQIFRGYVQPGFPLLMPDLLVTNGAVFAGARTDLYVNNVSAWNIMYAGTIPATVLVDEQNIVQGYDFWSPNRRTYVITRFFNIAIGKIAADVFDFPER